MKIQIPFPCSESNETMKDVQGGKFCESCSKVVIDFRNMTLDEITDYFESQATSQEVCGIIQSDLLENIEYSIPLEVVNSNSRNIRNVILICFMVAFGFMSFDLSAQTKSSTKKPTKTSQKSSKSKKKACKSNKNNSKDEEIVVGKFVDFPLENQNVDTPKTNKINENPNPINETTGKIANPNSFKPYKDTI